MQCEHADAAVERAGPVRRGDDDLVRPHDDGEFAVLGQRAALVVQRRDVRRAAAGARRPRPADEVGDERRLPVAPRGRSGGRRVGDRERVQQVQQLGRVVDGVADDA